MMPGATGPITKAISQRRSSRHQWRIFERVAMIILDIWLISGAFNLAYEFRYYLTQQSELSNIFNAIRSHLTDAGPPKGSLAPFSTFQPLQMGIVVGLILIFALRGLYRGRLTGTGMLFRQVWGIVSSATLGMAFMITYFFVFQPTASSRLLVPFVWLTTIVVLCVGRVIVSGAMSILYRLGLAETRLLVVGSGRLSKMIMQHIAANPGLGYSIVGFLHDIDANEQPGDFGRFKMLGTLDDIGLVIRSMQIDEVIIAVPSHMNQYAIRAVKMCERLGASFKLVPDLYELSLSRIDVESIEGIPLIGIKQVSLNTLGQLMTRVVDITIASLIVLVGLPLWICIGVAIYLSSPGPILYKSTRIGLNGQPFEMFKFRSMYQNADKVLARLLSQNEARGPIFKMKHDPRVTLIGRFMRRTSIDEFPQMLNIIKGDMSLVGPRPPLPHEVAQYKEWQKGRLVIRPGLTGLWQVRGRSDLSFDEGVLMDLYYIENWSLRLYFQILLRTIPAVLFRRGAY